MTTAILLAAGESRRMDRDNKLLLPFRDKPLIRHVAEELSGANIDEIIVVTGYQARFIKEALSGLSLQFVHNEGFYSGIISSIKAGLEKVDPLSQGILLCLGDMPILEAMHYNALIRKFYLELEQDKTPVIRPVYKEIKGDPIIFHKNFIPAIQAYRSEEEEMYEAVFNNSTDYLEYPLANQAYYIDMNTRIDYYKLRK